ncbi:MAG: hypothetical protein KDD99_09715 [Bacteroidetes bacterium]|nr:hypothetical protein [Bacteroidota bacterium]
MKSGNPWNSAQKSQSFSFPSFQNDSKKKAEFNHPLFPIAVFIMGIVSCYTTALGLEPMLDNLVLSYAMAIALSIFMVAIALQFPKSYQNKTQGRLIVGYSMVAIFSVLLNFNAIYGIFSSEKLLYEELKENKSRLTALAVKSKEALDQHFQAQKVKEELDQAMGLLEEERTNPYDTGYGQKARRINQEAVIPLKAKWANIQSKFNPSIRKIDSLTTHAHTVIDEALASQNFKEYKNAVDVSIDAYTQVGDLTSSMIDDGSFSYEPITFQHRDVGNLNHSLWTLGHLGEMEGRQVSAVLVSLLLAVLIDFIVLFVLILLHKPGAETKKEEKEETSGRVTFKDKPGAIQVETSPTNSIYAFRKNPQGQ